MNQEMVRVPLKPSSSNDLTEFTLPWFQAVYNLVYERARVQELNIDVAVKYEATQLATFLTERGNHNTPLATNPITYYEIEVDNGQMQVFILGMNDKGEWSRRFFDHEDIEGPVGIGLQSLFSGLVECDLGEGMGLVSPTELYAQNGSRGNVLNLLQVIDRNPNRITVAGFWLFFDKQATHEDRLWLREQLSSAASNELEVRFSDDASQLVASPFKLNNFDSHLELNRILSRKISNKEVLTEELSVTLEIANQIDEIWKAHKGKNLFDLDLEYEVVFRKRVNELIQLYSLPFLELLLNDVVSDEDIYQSLFWLILQAQEVYSNHNHLEWSEYLEYLLSPQFQYQAAFHPTNGEELHKYGIPELGIWWFDACDSTEKYCKECKGVLDGNGECRNCKNNKHLK